MNRKMKIKISNSVVLKSQGKDTLPVEALSNTLKGLYVDAVEISDLTPVSLTVTVKDDRVSLEDVKSTAIQFLLTRYQAGEKDISCTVEAQPREEAESHVASSEEADTSDVAARIRMMAEKTGSEDTHLSDKETVGQEDPLDTIGEDGKIRSVSMESTMSDAVKEIKAKIDALVGAEAFKALAEELIAIAPQINANHTVDIFTHQSYIFSINDGYGLSTCLQLFRDLVGALEMKKVNVRRPVYEEKLYAKSNSNPEPFSSVNQILSGGSKDALQFLMVDISEWMNKTESVEFKEFLHNLVKHMNEFIVVFRIPFVDKEVVAGIHHSLNDLVFVKTVSFPPLTNDEIRASAKAELEKYGFHMSASAWSFFDQRITEEKSDGRFYGLNTIHKVVRELLYKKQLANGKKGIDDRTIAEQDAQGLCTVVESSHLSAMEMLAGLVGADAIRSRVEEIVSQILLAKNNDKMTAPCIHMRFVGNPGTGKTTVARIVGKILKEKGVLRIGNFYEYAGRDFVGRYIGETAPKTASICRDAYGSVLFIDEAYSLYRGPDNERDFGREALDTLIAEMENHRSDLVIIMAGYTDDMEKLMQGNAGLASRMPYIIEFPNFTREELYKIFASMVTKDFSCDEELLCAAREYFLALPDELIGSKEFSNARFVRNLYERVWAKAAMRTQLEKGDTVVLTKGDFERSTADKEFRIIMKKKNRIGFVE